MFIRVFFPQVVKQTLQDELLQDVHEQSEGYGHAAYCPSVGYVEISNHEVRNATLWNHTDENVVGEDQDQHDHEPWICDEVFLPWAGDAEGNHTENIHEV